MQTGTVLSLKLCAGAELDLIVFYILMNNNEVGHVGGGFGVPTGSCSSHTLILSHCLTIRSVTETEQ